jgi:hypothetical protein
MRQRLGIGSRNEKLPKGRFMLPSVQAISFRMWNCSANQQERL